MKSFLFYRQITTIIALLLTIVMTFSACGASEQISSDVGNASNISSQEDVAANNNGNDEKTESIDKTESKTNNQNQSQKEEQTNKPSTVAKTTWDKDYLSTVPDSVKKKEIHVLMWRDYDPPEKMMVEAFQKKTGIKIRTTITTEQAYSTKLISLISAKDSPDVVMITTASFPGIVTKACQPLDPEVFRLDDSAWYKTYMDCFMVNGKYFTVAMNKGTNTEDTNYMTFYLKSVLKSCGIKTMPYDLYKDGKWNWETQRDIINKARSSGIGGFSMLNSDAFMYSAGGSFVKYDGKKYTNNMDDPCILEGWREAARLKEEGSLEYWDHINVAQGKIALFQAIAYQGLSVSEAFTNVVGGKANVNCVPMAGPKDGTTYNPVRAKCWGVAKGAKNVEGAAYFLRYFLDVKNAGEYSSLFINKQVQEVYDIICDKKSRKIVTYSQGVVSFTDKALYSNMCDKLSKSTPSQLSQTLSTYKATINSPIKNANTALKRVK